MKPKQPNPKRERAQEFAATLRALSDAQRAEVFANCPGVLTIEGRLLSPHNSALVMHQLPTATVVGGFRQWLAAGRQVRKGETACYLFAPGKSRDDDENATVRFLMVAVFDISQTDIAEAQEGAA